MAQFSLIFSFVLIFSKIGFSKAQISGFPEFYLLVGEEADYSLESYLFYWEDPGNMDAEQAYQFYRQGKFAPIGHPYLFNRGYSNSIWWFALPIENGIAKDNTLILSPAGASLQEARLYTFDGSGKLSREQVSGYLLKDDERDMATRLNSFKISLEPFQKSLLLLRIDTRGRNMYMPFYMDSTGSYWEYEVNRAALFGGISTIMAFASLFAFLLFLYNRERIYLIFLAYILSCLLLILEEDGYAFDWFYGQHFPELSQVSVPLFGLLTCSLFLKFNLLFMENQIRSHMYFHIAKSTYYVTLTWCIVLLLSIFLIEEKKFLYAFNLTSLYMSFGCVGLVLIGNILNITDKKALYILFANIFLVIGLVFYFLNSHGITSLNPFFPNGLVVGALVNVLAFTIAIGYLQYSERKEKQLLKVQIAEREKEFIEDKFRVQEEERQRIARDLHDDLGALLAMIRLKVENVEGKLDHVNGPIRENIAESVRLLDKATKEVRFIAHELLPEELGQKRFSTLVEELFLNLENQEKIRFHNNIGELPILPTHVKANLFRIIKELLNNIFKHSGATDGELELFYDEEDVEIKLIVADNGRGFDLEQVKSGKKGMGLNNLESRVFFLNGTYEISSGPQGTTILICVPYKVNEYERGQQNNTGSHRG